LVKLVNVAHAATGSGQIRAVSDRTVDRTLEVECPYLIAVDRIAVDRAIASFATAAPVETLGPAAVRGHGSE
jgi:hypothetical protein